MRMVRLKEFGSIDLKGYDFVFTIENQTRDYRDRRWSVTRDRRVFTRIDVALNPDCVMLTNSHQECLCLDGVDHVNIREWDDGCDYFYFDIVCGVGSLKDQIYTFLAQKRKRFEF